MLMPFSNESLTDFTRPENVEAFQSALDRMRAELGRSYPLIIGGQRVETAETFDSINPAQPAQVVGHFAKANERLAAEAIETATEAFNGWKRTSPKVRARYLLKAAAILRRRKHEFSAWMVYEVGKSWTEADGETTQAIDLLEFYAREIARLDVTQPIIPYPGREVELRYIPLGVGVVISPWNFPLYLTTGMMAAALVSGNTIVLKPASASPTVVYKLVEVFNDELLLPPGVLNFVPGPGSAVGDTLVTHPRTRFVAFTGSKEVGLRIHELAARPQPGQLWIKRTILEMGGKNAILVDETADLEAAAEGIVVSAFGYQGQKCSACSRAILVEEIYDRLLERIVERTRQITVGPTVLPSNWMGPVIDRVAFQKILDYIELGYEEGRLVFGGHALDTPEGGYFIEPTIFADVEPNARIAQEEIFGPVLAVIRARDFDEGLRIANSTEYGLTGAVYSRDRQRLERAREDFHVGNLYFNRKCTGALVGVEPFGGFNMSGTDSKLGSPDYLLLFTQAKVISELW
ncbi:MAG: L-glutamate gamma-semialdehyde dehydrogenase [Anaerolineae bacterium]|nr:L-glutamate gamma-semialdehyde dehydrogenase [Anaerolineae bacterium]MDW8098794.1 L-glutamate gamma-semialdehyde dehydrogenase [Anaerolineae bacterium]